MENLPPKDIMRRLGTFNKMSKIYHQQHTDIQFADVEQAKDFFWTKEGKDLFRYCCDTQYELINESRSLHWTVNFGEPVSQAPQEKWADIFKDKKAQMVADETFFKNNPRIDHSAEHLF